MAARSIRSTYFLAGQAIATRVTGDPVSGNNGLFYFYNDHLGSSSVLVNSNNNNVVSGSRTWYLPFGRYRPGSTPTQTITGRNFTGQKKNMELGLLYYNARYYVPGLGRFASADTIVPNPTNPQSYNRYSYVRNSPLNFTDPSGHIKADCENNACGTVNGSAQPFTSPFFNFIGDVALAEKQFAHQAASAISRRMAEAVNPLRRMEAKMDGTAYTPLSAKEAFLSVFGGPITIVQTDEDCDAGLDCRAEAFSGKWQKSRSGDPVEEFADMGMGWTYNQWETLTTGGRSDYGNKRNDFMNVNMAIWLNDLLP